MTVLERSSRFNGTEWIYTAGTKTGPLVTNWQTDINRVHFDVIGDSVGPPKLFATVHLPKILFGHNIGILNGPELHRALEYMSKAIDCLEFSSELPPFDEWNVARLDFGYSWRVDNPNEIIRDMSAHVNSRVTAGTFVYEDKPSKGATATVSQNTFTRKFYNKEAQIESKRIQKWGKGLWSEMARRSKEHARDVLRFESSNRNDRVNKTILKNGRTVADLKAFIDTDLENWVRRDCDDLTKGYSPTKTTDAMQKIFKHKDERSARALFKFYATVQFVGRRRYLEMAPNKTEFSAQLRELHKCGVGFGSRFKPSFLPEIPSDKVVFCHDLAFFFPDDDPTEFEYRTGLKTGDPRIVDLTSFMT